jgi:hypothetical protein
MTTINLRQEILKQINHLSNEQLNQVLQFINQVNQGENTTPSPESNEKGTYEKFVQSGLIGCVEIEENLSTTYKQVLAEGLAKKYDRR